MYENVGGAICMLELTGISEAIHSLFIITEK